MTVARVRFAAALLMLLAVSASARAEEGRIVLVSKAPFATVAARLEQAIADQRMGLVCHANAQQGAATRGVKIPGNQVFMVFRNDFAVRLIQADPPAAYEAPIRMYLYENADGTATLTYVRPSALFQPYRHPEVTKVGAELDPIFEKIAAQAVAAR
ncbi:MAG: DUF302 domain-containing protein [Candidatus Rokubacteria bacterium]|nr:DUF302 domain-containing protein [Candidatus Rokubacteria bacterium]